MKPQIGQRITYTNDHGETKSGAVFCLVESVTGPTDILLVKPDNCGSMLETTRIADIAPEQPAPGFKADTGKYRHSLLPEGALREVTAVLEHGAQKYAPENWKRVPDARTRYYDAAHRHIESWWSGHQHDTESNLHHLAHAACCLLFLIWLDHNGGDHA